MTDDTILSVAQANSELTLETIKQRSVHGVIALTGRTFILQAINFVSLAFFTILFTQVEYGIYGIALAVRGFLTYFSDIGLAAALIQKRNKVTKNELGTTFIIQQSLVILLVAIGFAATPFLARWQQLTTPGIYLLWSFYIGFLLSSLKTIPSVLLERKLEFTKLVIPQIFESIAFNLVAIGLAWSGFGIISLAYAVLVQSIVGLVSIYILKPWRPKLVFSLDSIRGLFKFGVPYQLNTFLAVLKDDGLVIVLGGILGPANLGLLLWAKKWGEAPLRFFMDQVIKVTFPAFSRLQDDHTQLKSALSRSIFFICLLVFPAIAGLMLLAPLLTEVVPKYEKWEPALFALNLFGLSAGIAAITTPLTNMLNAIGRIRTTFKLMIMWVILTWAIMPYFANRGGVNGAALGALLIGLSSVVAIVIAYKYVKFDVSYSIVKPLLGTTAMATILYFLRTVVPVSWLGVSSLIITGVIFYSVVISLLIGPTLAVDARKVWYAIAKKQ
ncbi:MAG: hypothetical protein A3D26_03135 [Candidatus Blackburnbacteria bacterium RIFCSPHIGHO2_02_FULL_44_20]|uniref:Uncharacterized protein n=1 Tax=Candidatus Blackburnbacteria bacterium RIFCSPHIGHO2_02_FULL_44_20 TaxID=1797516 RepID=A0A1G1V930_9BACT|nr:MAG: hypothetical protein A3E16_00930 [Candidatus Blackburnbacteria bacterium RIFCSPHIGHO2_12_FULL_44_25]OGY11958.1 MAG: hypothetical protein A3D26_03135 [Candidatus Blackburnbacteria bacterium RIFCSPHIGHO2_02_FULL_44_20]